MHSPATHDSIAEVELWLGTALPTEYAKFLDSYDERLIGEQVLLYAAQSLIERNETYETKVYCPGFLTIGDDSGGRAIVIPIERPLGEVYLVSHGSMSISDFVLLPRSFNTWLEEGCPVE